MGLAESRSFRAYVCTMVLDPGLRFAPPRAIKLTAFQAKRIGTHSRLTCFGRIAFMCSWCFCIFLCGCSVTLTKNDHPSKSLQNAKWIEPNTEPMKVIRSTQKSNPSAIVYNSQIIDLVKPCTVKYNVFYFDYLNMIVVQGKLPNGKNYPVLLDTGAAEFAYTNVLTVVENDLAICPFFDSNSQMLTYGYCYIPSFQIGSATITNPPCVYLDQHWEVKLMGLSVWQQKGLVLGIPLLKEFSYLEFDNIKKAVRFSGKQQFEPCDINLWDRFSLEVKMDEQKQKRLFVTMPIADINLAIPFDTCGRNWLILNQQTWDKISKNINAGKIKQSSFVSGWIGELPCTRISIKNFRIGNQIIKDDEIIILPENSVFKENILGIKYFKNKMFVLDFKRNLMWVKKCN